MFSFGSGNEKTTYTQALSLNESQIKLVLNNILTDYIQERISWLLTDLGEKNNQIEKITEEVRKYVEFATTDISYDDTKKIVLTLLKNQRFLRSETASRRKVIEIISGAMTSLNLGNPRYSTEKKRRVIQTVK